VSQFSDERGTEMRDLFFETAQDLLQSLNDDALKLEKAPQDTETIRSIRRTVHTLKGDAAACGFKELSELAHLLEDALAVDVASSQVSLAELGFTAADVFSSMLAAYRQQGSLPDTTPLKNMVRDLSPGSESSRESSTRKAADNTQVVWTEYETLSAKAAQAEGKKVFHVSAQIDPLCTMPIAARQLVANALAAVATVLGARPEPGSHGHAKTLDLLVATTVSEIDIIGKCRIPTVISLAQCFEPKLAAPTSENSDLFGPSAEATFPAEHSRDRATSSEPEENSTAKSSSASENVLRVDAERIDVVLNLVGELIIGKSMLQQVMHEFSHRYPKDALRARFADAMAIQSRVLNDLQRSVMKVRMVPVAQLFRRFPRLVRDAAKRCNKQVQLIISGQDTDVDKGLLDAIAEPLTHIVRNAIGHGLETTSEREAAGKPGVGKVRLDAYHQGNQLIVEVGDDGRGIDEDKIKAKALKGNLVAADELERMSNSEILDLVFRPGFSTADEITEISGRGVGLDVVRSVLHRLKGTVELDTRPGQGTSFRLKLPLTLAIIKALLFRVEHRLYAIPLNSVAEIARAQETDLHLVDDCEVVQLRGKVLPLVRLGRKPAGDWNERRGKIFVLVMALGGRRLGLIVDSLDGEEELVIKALDDQTVATDLVSGASILGDGRVVLIMNLSAVVERFARSRSANSGLLLSDVERNRSLVSSEVLQ
jgi:two-component system chemotaxis sensor kinase CheA